MIDIAQGVSWGGLQFLLCMLPKIKKLIFEVEFQQTQSPYQGRSGDAFLHKFNELRQALLNNIQQFIPIDVVPRQPPAHFILASGRLNRNIYLDTKKNKLVEFPRRNSFEIYVDNFHLFSRLDSGNWPDVNAICEWALRVAEKIVDVQIEKEEAPLKDLMLAEKIATPDVVVNQRLPPVSRGGFDQTIRNRPEKSQLSNYYPRSRYSSMREDDGLMPYGVDPMNATTTQRRPYLTKSLKSKGKTRSIDKQLKTISKDFYGGSKDQSFHWNIKQKPIKPLFTGRYPNALINTIDVNAKIPNVELSPLPAVHEKSIVDKQQEAVSEIKMDVVELRLSQSPLNIHTKHYRIETNKVVKNSCNQTWSPILCQTPLPLIGEYSFQIFVNHSAQNQVQLGVAPLNYYPRMDQLHKPDSLISFNCGSGQIKDGKHNQFASETQWREGGVKVTLRAPFCLKVSVNTKSKLIEWYANDSMVASAKLTSQYITGFRAFISLFHTRDVISLNKPLQTQNILDTLKNQQQKGIERITANAFCQTGIETANKTDGTKGVLNQNRIYPNFKQKQVPMVDEVTQTTHIIEGRIKRQRFHKFLQKSQPEKIELNKGKEDFSIEDVKTYKTIFANQSYHQNEWSVNEKQGQNIQVKISTINLVIVQKQIPQPVEKASVEVLQPPPKEPLPLRLQSIIQNKDERQQGNGEVKKQEHNVIVQQNLPIQTHETVIHTKQSITKIQPQKQQQPQLPNQPSPPLPLESPLPHKEDSQPAIQDKSPIIPEENRQVAKKDESLNWEGAYQQGVFKLKPILT